MIKAYGQFLALAFNLREKTTRKEYWLATFVNALIFILFSAGSDGFFRILTGVLLPRPIELIFAFAAMIWLICFAIFLIGTIVPGLTMSYRRYRDAGLSAWTFIVEFGLYFSFFILASEYLLNGFITTFSTLLAIMFVLADVLVKLLPSDRREEVATLQD